MDIFVARILVIITKMGIIIFNVKPKINLIFKQSKSHLIFKKFNFSKFYFIIVTFKS